jgi:myo-inositol-1(or 4)-monophosphatase
MKNWLPGLLIAREAGADMLTAAGQPWQWTADSLLVTAPGLGGTYSLAQLAAH